MPYSPMFPRQKRAFSGPCFPPYTSSIVTRRPTIAAARCRRESVISLFGSSIRSTARRAGLAFEVALIQSAQSAVVDAPGEGV